MNNSACDSDCDLTSNMESVNVKDEATESDVKSDNSDDAKSETEKECLLPKTSKYSKIHPHHKKVLIILYYF